MERRRALSTITTFIIRSWKFPHGFDNAKMITFVSQTSQFRIVPKLYIHGNPAIDIGGVFREKISETFEFLLQQSCFVNDISVGITFREYLNPMEMLLYENSYTVLGKIIYWFVFIHRYIPYPKKLDPAIIAFAIYGYIPESLVSESVARIVALIRTYNSNTSEDAIDDEVLIWLSGSNDRRSDLSSFVQTLRDPNKGSEYIIRRICTTSCIGVRNVAFDNFRLGFISGHTNFTSVSSMERTQLIV